MHNLLTHASCQLDIATRCEDFCMLRRLLRVTALVLKFVALLKLKAKGDDEVMPTISAADITNSELTWIKLSQAFVHREEFNVWHQQFILFCDKDGVWRCKGRLHHANLPETS